MHSTRLVARLRARLAAGVGQFRDTVLPRHASPVSARKAGSSRKRKRGGATPH
jgi:hypothetical protein